MEKINNYLDHVLGLYEQLFISSWTIKSFYLVIILISALAWYLILNKELKVKAIASTFIIGISVLLGWRVGNFTIFIPGLMIAPSLCIALIFTFFSYLISIGSVRENKYTILFKTNRGTIPMDFRRHAGIFGGSGAGKTDSGYVPIIQHIFKYGLAASVYDYKDFELWEKILYFHKQRNQLNNELISKGKTPNPLPDLRVWYPNDPNLSDHLNFLDPDLYLTDIESMESIAQTFFDNLYPGDGDGNFFKESGQAIFAGVTWRMKEDFPEYCDFPHVSSIILNASGEQLMQFIEKSSRASILAAPFLKAKGNEKQLGSVISSVAAAIKKVSTPKMYITLRKNDFDLAINREGNKTVFACVNVPALDTVYGPVIATIKKLMVNQMSERGRDYSIMVWDEASTFKFDRLDKLLATLRTYNIMVVWGLQDKIQGAILYSENILRAIFSNLGIKMMGKANDPDTAQFYQRMFETKEIKQKSVSQSERGKSTTTSVQEKAKYKVFDYQRLKPGEFFFLDTESRDKKARVNLIPYENIKAEKKNNYTREQIESHFDQVINRAREIIQQETEVLEE